MQQQPLVFITGASSGIGQAFALRYYRAGWRLALLARDTQKIDTWAQTQGLAAHSYSSYAADVAQPGSICAAAHACLQRQGLPEVVIASAGISLGVDTARREDIDVMARVLATNTLGVAATFQAFITPMVDRGSGRLVALASVAGVRGLPGHGAYCASKAGVIAYCESLRGELRGSGVRVVTLSPGYIDTPLTRANRYPMPFLLTADEFVRRAQHAIDTGASACVIPWQMSVVARLLALLPNAVFDRLLVGRQRKHRAGE